MKNKRFFRSFFVMLAALVVLGGFSVTAYAYSGEETSEETTVQTEAEATTPEVTEPQEPEASEVQEPEEETTGGVEPQPFTPEGNMNLVDEIQGEASEDKEFIVVQSKGGNYFYIVIDHAAQGGNTVHFLNQVDEADLMAIIEDENGQTQEATATCTCTDKCEAGNVDMNCSVCAVNMSECVGKEAAAETPDEPEQTEESGGIGGIILFAVVVLLGGGGALYYFKVMKPKQATKGNTDLEDFDFDEYEDEPQNEDEQTEADENQEDKE